MAPDASDPLQFPPALQARLDAAGVTDDAAFQAALDADPHLRADFETFLRENPELLAAMQMNALVQAFAGVGNADDMLAFWRTVPSELEQPLIQTVEALIAEAQTKGDDNAAQALSSRLDGFRHFCDQAAQRQELPPIARALLAFAQAADEAAATAVFEEQRVFLQPYEAQQMMDALAAQPQDDADAATRHRIIARRDLLRRLRGMAPTPAADPSPLAPRNSPLPGDLNQAERQYIGAAHAEGGGDAIVVNNIFIQNIERRWTRPIPPDLRRDVVERPHEMALIKDELAARGSVAITGLRRTPSVTVQGMAGVGKTVLAHLLAHDLDGAYPDGILWESLGPDFVDPTQAQAVLRRWAGYATSFFEQDENLKKLFTFEPPAVRALLAEHPRLLVVLDNLWSYDAARPLLDALPRGAHLIVTTRDEAIAQSLGAGLVAVGRLAEAEALALFALRLGWQPDPDDAADAWAVALIDGVGRHALGLDVALGVLRREGGPNRGEWQASARRLLAAIARGDFADLWMGDDLDHNVQVVLRYSVRTLDATAARFRRTGCVCPRRALHHRRSRRGLGLRCRQRPPHAGRLGRRRAAGARRPAAGAGASTRCCAAWPWRCCTRQGEAEAAAAAHARTYAAAMAAAERAQRSQEMLPALPQLRHAMAWALANDLDLALDIAANSANLQKQFGLVAEAGLWSDGRSWLALRAPGDHLGAGRRSPAAALRRAGRLRRRPALLSAPTRRRSTTPDPEQPGEPLSELATLPGEDRRQRLHDALAGLRRRPALHPPGHCPARLRHDPEQPGEQIERPGDAAWGRSAAAAVRSPGRLRRRPALQYTAGQPGAARLRHDPEQPGEHLLSEMATLPGEDRRQRLHEALAAYDDALRYRSAGQWPRSTTP